MRTAKYFVAAGLVVCGMPGLANAQWYVGADAGANYSDTTKAKALGSKYKTEYDWGYAVLGQVGYSFGAPKIEFELGYRDNDVKKIAGASGVNGDLGTFSQMVNGIYDFMPNARIHPFLGAGIGGAYVRANDVRLVSGGSSYSADGYQFAYQGIAGIGYDIDRNWTVKAQYRYFATTDLSDRVDNVKVKLPNSNQSVLVGLTYRFNSPAPAPVIAPPPAPVAMPAPPPVPVKPMPAPQKNFMVFFDFDKAVITPQASRIITEAAAAAKAGHSTSVNVTGYTDLSGTVKYNMALSIKRANAVKDSLVAQGVPANEIVVVGKGKSDPLVPTKDGVREPQNRRVTIVLE
jgi:OmpA-OmpF porin, OOP family